MKQVILLSLIFLLSAVTLNCAPIAPFESYAADEEVEAEAIRLWREFCSGNSKDTNSDGFTIVYCRKTSQSTEDDVHQRSPEVKLSEKETSKGRQEVEKSNSHTPALKENSPDRIFETENNRSSRRRIYYARKNAITVTPKAQQSVSVVPEITTTPATTSENPTEITVAVSQIRVETGPNHKRSRVAIIRRNRKKNGRNIAVRKKISREHVADVEGSSANVSVGQGRVAAVDVKPVSLFVSGSSA